VLSRSPWNCRDRVSYSAEARMKKPTIRVTKWLGDIPIQAVCSACPGVVFKAKGSGHRPNREEYQKSLQEQFDRHYKEMH
jgi:hypothetical protein